MEGKVSVVTFVGGSLDLTRAAVENVSRAYRVPRLSALPSIGRPLAEGEALPGDLSFYEEVYRIETAFDRAGNEVFVGIFQYATDKTPSEIKRLRKELDQANIDKAAMRERLDADAQRIVLLKRDLNDVLDVSIRRRDELADAQGRLSAVANVLNAAEPNMKQAASPVSAVTGYPACSLPDCKMCGPR